MDNKVITKLSYRPDIDGLRAFAVSAVVLFHCGFYGLSGGFIGVDIFFVISGYLITSLLVRDLTKGNFSLTAFYAKRIRRLYPALVFTLLITLFGGYFIFMPDEFKELGQSAVSVVTYLSNIFFWLKSDYFDGPSELKPLLHTWSLAVEEQFYIIFPLIMILVFKLHKQFRNLALFTLLLLSLIACTLYVRIDNSATFFFMPFRIWEFLTGALCTLAVRLVVKNTTREIITFIGLLLIALSVVLIDESMLFPGVSATPVCLGTALVIAFNNSETYISRFLAAKPIVFVGKISYSTYLIHWPLVVFYTYYIIREINLVEKLTLVFLSFLFGYIIYSTVENRFRKGKITPKESKSTFMYTVVFSVFVACIGGFIHIQDGFKQRFAVAKIANADTSTLQPNLGKCFLSTNENFEKWSGNSCFIGAKKESKSNTLLWGDSHANHLVYGIYNQKETIKSNILLFANAGCPSIFDAQPNNRPNCAQNNSNVIKIIETHDINHVILSSNWQYAVAQGVKLDKLVDTIKTLKESNVKVSLINQLPIYPINNPEYLILRLSNGKPFDEDWHLKPSKGQRTTEKVSKIVKTSNIPTINSMATFCKHGKCKIIDKGNLMVKDAGHLSRSGSDYFISSLLRQKIEF
ncbi:acyltransferase family protein [Alteromonas stellipolaris]|uniref:acyltransferase family protein n=1 Tax=Alteromonas stellipolaris TaxID=233316 RepID=UPI002735D9EC|nr:acyltransferase family protein [Alteromonas stellipolaris]MDP2596924.1 acyltransferase family protein [Alteromonas stellipolaris]